MLRVCSVILSLYEEPKQVYAVSSVFASILSSKSFWKERHQREGLPYMNREGLSLLRTYYLTKEFVCKETTLSCHLSELPFFPSFAQGEEYYARAIKFRREQVSQAINHIVLDKCTNYYSKGYEGWSIDYNYNSNKTKVDKAIENFENAFGINDPGHPSLDVYVKLCRASSGKYIFYLYLDLPQREGRVEVPVQNTLIDVEQALSFYLQLQN
ncbi:hypothetical protein BQ9231_00520 [Cedratvirus lausannensis]|uniref:Uncharacterized protein n=1 Tax=Cedratvirus lausannensis TaxID=2023205 RepID=A0A285PXK5_9VIRU|nr:hypothetical protein BQ9231_00520 [Cedratvirus lausannensis]